MKGQSEAICRGCLRSGARLLTNNVRARTALMLYASLHKAWFSSTTSGCPSQQPHRPWQSSLRRVSTKSETALIKTNLNALHARVQELTQAVLQPTDGPIPSEQRVLHVLEQIDAIARNVADAKSIAGAVSLNGSATSALLGSVNSKRQLTSITKAQLLRSISIRADDMLRSSNVFITPAILKEYVQLQRMLHQPASFAEIFWLYATKPTPDVDSKGVVTYKQTSARNAKAAIDYDTASAALDTAIKAHDLKLALRIIDTSFAAPAYGRAKLLRQCALPGVGLALLPAIAYGISTQFGSWQPMMDQSQATTIAFAGIMTYVGVVGSMGYVVLTTANDQMDRVTWAHGVPLWERWLREDERAALDRIADAWGFKSLEKRGDEEGEDWEILRETCGRRGMELDRVELMEGMQ